VFVVIVGLLTSCTTKNDVADQAAVLDDGQQRLLRVHPPRAPNLRAHKAVRQHTDVFGEDEKPTPEGSVTFSQGQLMS
jgi:hypothetical protein